MNFTDGAGISEDAADLRELYLTHRTRLLRVLSESPARRIQKEIVFLEKNRPFFGMIDSQDKVYMGYSLLLTSLKRIKVS